MQNDNKANNESTVGEVGSSLAGGFDENKDEQTNLTQEDLKGKKVDGDPLQESDKPSK